MNGGRQTEYEQDSESVLPTVRQAELTAGSRALPFSPSRVPWFDVSFFRSLDLFAPDLLRRSMDLGFVVAGFDCLCRALFVWDLSRLETEIFYNKTLVSLRKGLWTSRSRVTVKLQ